MNIIVETDGGSEEAFRKNKKFREEVGKFFQTGAGSLLLHLLKKRSEIKPKSQAVPHEAIATYSVAELSRLAGAQSQVDFIVEMCGVPAVVPQKLNIPHLGEHEEKDLVPKFVVNVPDPAKKK